MDAFVEKYRSKFQSYSLFATRIQDLVTHLIEQSGTKVHFVESRAKTPESFAEKIKRPGKRYQNPLEEVPDLVGVRVVLYYNDGIKSVGELLKQEFDVLEEEAGHQAAAYGADQFGYLSMHYVVKLHKKRKDLPEWQEWKSVRAEIQVRSVLQHSWAAVSHALQYKREGDVPLGLRRRLHRLAGLFELADEEFVGIRDEANAISQVTKASLQSNPDSVPIDVQSIRHFLDKSPEFKKLRKQSLELGYIYDADEQTESEDSTDYVAVIVEACHRLGLSVMADFKRILNFDAVPFLKAANDGEWHVSDDFLAFLLLIKAKPDAFTVEGLVAEGWAQGIAERVINAAKKTK